MQTNNEYTWTDKWRVRYTNWGTDEPKLKSACVYMDVDGYWKTSYCNESFYFLCKKSDGNWMCKRALGNLKMSEINYYPLVLTLLTSNVSWVAESKIEHPLTLTKDGPGCQPICTGRNDGDGNLHYSYDLLARGRLLNACY